MFSVFVYAFNAIMPILLLVILGYRLKCSGIFTKEWLRTANQFNFHYCLFALMFCNVYALDDIGSINWGLAVFVIISLIILTGVGFIVANFVTKDRARKGVMIQASFRSNYAVIGLTLAESLAVPGGLALTAAMQAPTVIYFNFMTVLVLSMYSENKNTDYKKVLINITKNPLIRGLVLGLIALVLREFIPRNPDGSLVFSLSGSLPFLYSAINNLSKIGTPLALIVLGGQFEFSAVRNIGRELSCGVLSRLVLAPVIGFTLAFTAAHLGLISITPDVTAMLLPLYSSPVAVSSAVMAAEMGADEQLAGQLVVWTTLLSLFTLFFQIALLRFAGLL